jgi:hypothetical protein
MDYYTVREYTDSHLIPDEARGNGPAAVRLYSERYLQRRLSNPRTFHTINGRIRETGTARPSTADRGRPRNAPTVAVEERILRRVEGNPRTSARRIQAAENLMDSC